MSDKFSIGDRYIDPRTDFGFKRLFGQESYKADKMDMRSFYDMLDTATDEGREPGKKEGREQGREEAREQGREEGRDEARTLMARKLLGRGESLQSVADITGLSVEDLKRIAQG